MVDEINKYIRVTQKANKKLFQVVFTLKTKIKKTNNYQTTPKFLSSSCFALCLLLVDSEQLSRIIQWVLIVQQASFRQTPFSFNQRINMLFHIIRNLIYRTTKLLCTPEPSKGIVKSN